MKDIIKLKKGEKIFILAKHNGEYQGWHKIKKEELNKWILDGSIREGDLVVISNKIMEAYEKVTLKFKDAEQNKEEQK